MSSLITFHQTVLPAEQYSSSSSSQTDGGPTAACSLFGWGGGGVVWWWWGGFRDEGEWVVGVMTDCCQIWPDLKPEYSMFSSFFFFSLHRTLAPECVTHSSGHYVA